MASSLRRNPFISSISWHLWFITRFAQVLRWLRKDLQMKGLRRNDAATCTTVGIQKKLLLANTAFAFSIIKPPTFERL